MSGEGRAAENEFRVILTAVPAANVQQIVEEISRLFEVDGAFAAQIVRSAPIILLDKLTPEQAPVVTENLSRLRFLGAEVSLMRGPIVGRMQRLSWPNPPPFLRGAETVFVCPNCGERLVVERLADRHALAAAEAAAVTPPVQPPASPAAPASEPAAPAPPPAAVAVAPAPPAPAAPKMAAPRPAAPRAAAPPAAPPPAPPAAAAPQAAPGTPAAAAVAEPQPLSPEEAAAELAEQAPAEAAKEPAPEAAPVEKPKTGLFARLRRGPEAPEAPKEQAPAPAAPPQPPRPAVRARAAEPAEQTEAVAVESGPFNVFVGGLTGAKRRVAVPLIMKFRGVSESEADSIAGRTIVFVLEGVSAATAEQCAREFKDAGIRVRVRRR